MTLTSYTRYPRLGNLNTFMLLYYDVSHLHTRLCGSLDPMFLLEHSVPSPLHDNLLPKSLQQPPHKILVPSYKYV